MDLKLFYTGPLQVNTYLCVDTEAKKGFIVDPGGISKPMDNYIESNSYDIEYIILTHGHPDHVGGVPYYKEKFPNAKIVGHKGDKILFAGGEAEPMFASMFQSVAFEPDLYVDEGDTLNVGSLELKILYTPGHSRGGISILVDNVVFCGDTLFAGSIGRTDLGDASLEVLLDSVRSKLFVLPDDTYVLPGHMEATTVGNEKKNNPFFNNKFSGLW